MWLDMAMLRHSYVFDPVCLIGPWERLPEPRFVNTTDIDIRSVPCRFFRKQTLENVSSGEVTLVRSELSSSI